jgi:hypothetical protein
MWACSTILSCSTRSCAGGTVIASRLTRLKERRTLLVDERQGLVLDLARLDNPGTAATVELPEAGRINVPASCRAPWTDLHAQLFKIDGGRIAHIEGLVRRVPYGQGSGWSA